MRAITKSACDKTVTSMDTTVCILGTQYVQNAKYMYNGGQYYVHCMLVLMYLYVGADDSYIHPVYMCTVMYTYFFHIISKLHHAFSKSPNCGNYNNKLCQALRNLYTPIYPWSKS